MIDLSLLPAVFALSAAATWGAGDFTGGMAARRVGSFRTIFISYIFGLLGLAAVALATREALSAPADLLWGALAGLLGVVGLGCLLRGFSIGRMGVVAPISAVLGTAIPVLFTALTQGLPREVQLAGFALAVVGIWLLSRPEALGRRPAGLGFALLAGLGFGAFFTALGQVGQGAVFWPLVAGRLACVVALASIAVAARRPVRVPRPALGLIALAGLLDVLGNLFFLLAVQAGRLDVVTVLSSLYPAITTLLARLVAGEHMAPLQVAGVTASVLAIVLITI